MESRILVLLLVALLCSTTIVMCFEFPTVDSISEMFNDLKTKATDSTTDEESKNERSYRQKRQSAEIGDESLLPYEVKSSA